VWLAALSASGSGTSESLVGTQLAQPWAKIAIASIMCFASSLQWTDTEDAVNCGKSRPTAPCATCSPRKSAVIRALSPAGLR
jgi:hypothetical protein